MRALLTVAAVVALAGCEHPGPTGPYVDPGRPAQQIIAVEAAQYVPGEPIRFRVANRTSRTFGYNLCRSRLERRDGEGDWHAVLESLGPVCTAELRTLRPGQAVEYTFKPEGRLRRGEYRISTDLEDYQMRVRVLGVSNSFSIARDD